MYDRSKGITGSDIAAILGVSPWNTAVDVWERKTGRAQSAETNLAMSRGLFLENALLDRYEAERGITLERQVELVREHRFGTADGRTGNTIVEIKTASPYSISEWGEDGSTEIPIYYLTQVMWYMHLANAERADIMLLVVPRNPDLLIGATAEQVVERSRVNNYVVHRDVTAEAAIVERADEFWHRHVLADVPPNPICVDDLRHTILKDKTKDATELEAQITRYIDLGTAISELEREKKDLKEQIMLFAGECNSLSIGGHVRLRISEVTRKEFTVKASTIKQMRVVK